MDETYEPILPAGHDFLVRLITSEESYYVILYPHVPEVSGRWRGVLHINKSEGRVAVLDGFTCAEVLLKLSLVCGAELARC